MNELIKQLAAEAKIKPMGSSWTSRFGAEFEEKFAELIVRECAEMVRIQNEQFMENESHYGVVSTDILKHFGLDQ